MNQIYQQALFKNQELLDGLINQRGLTLDTIKEFGIGFAESYALNGFKKNKLEELQELSILNENNNEIFWNRLTIPVKNESGQVVGFNGRIASDNHNSKSPKYLLSRANPHFSKANTVYNLDQAGRHIKQSDFVYIVEGMFDVMAFHQMGIKNVVSMLGTEISPEQIQTISKYTDNFVLAYDGDVPGFIAVLETGKKISEFMQKSDLTYQAKNHMKVISFSEGQDAADYLRTPLEFEKVVSELKTFPAFCNLKFNLENEELKLKYEASYHDFKERAAKPNLHLQHNQPSKLTQAIVEQVHIIDIVGQHTSEKLTRSGKNFMTKCILPDHDDSTASFNVMPDKGIFKCFGCKKSGNVISLVAELEKIGYLEAREKLKQDYQIQGFGNRKIIDNSNDKEKQEIMKFMLGYSQYCLREYDNKNILNQVISHGISLENIERFGIGYIPAELGRLADALERSGHSLELATEIGLLKLTEKGYEASVDNGFSMAQKDKFGKITEFEHYPSDGISSLKTTINKMNKNLMPVANQQLTIAR